jgi:hypothetical protein
LSSAENTPLLDKDLHAILGDVSNCCEFTCFVDRNGETVVKIKCVVNEDEKERVWDLMGYIEETAVYHQNPTKPMSNRSYSIRV